MSLDALLDFVNARDPDLGRSVGEIYGTEHFCLWLHALLRMERPAVIVELGIGAGVTTFLAAEALRANAHGKIWAVDDGSDWATNADLRATIQGAFGYADASESFDDFVRRSIARFGLGGYVEHVKKRLDFDRDEYFAPDAPIDVLFADAPPSDAEGCISLLRYYLPRMSAYSSVFIDRASTLNHSYLLLEYVVGELEKGKIPAHLMAGLTAAQQAAVRHLVATSRFSLVHLTETKHGKRNQLQNSRAWIRIQPNDYLPHNDVASVVSR